MENVAKTYKYDLDEFSRLFVVGIGKPCVEAASQLEKILGPRISQGIVIDVEKKPLKFIKAFKGAHPTPSYENEKATSKVIKMLSQARPDDLVLILIFGGGSALLCSLRVFSVLTSVGMTTASRHI